MEKVIEVKVEDIKRAFDEANDNVKNSILNLFPKFKEAIPVTDRVKTFKDACREVNIDPKLYMIMCEKEPADVIAYKKLRVICKALNEGWTPRFVEGEWRYYLYIHICSEDEIIRMSEEEKSRVVFRSNINTVAEGGFSCAVASYVSASVHTGFGSLLAFKTKELAEYAGRQFIDLWADFCLTKK